MNVDGRVPPHNLEAEEAVLGAMLLSADVLERGRTLLADVDFYRPAHRTVWTAITALAGKGQPVDPVTVGHELDRLGQLADVGGAPLLHTLVSSVPTTASIDYYAAIVRDASALRRLIDTGTRITQLGYETPQDIGRAVTEATLLVSRVAASMNGHSPTGEQVAEELLAGLRDGAWLDEQLFSPLTYAVPGVIPEGSVLLVGPPKIGKSWFVLTVALAAASGGRALGIKVEQRPVLYLALEDGDRRLQDRCRRLLRGAPIPPGFQYLTRVVPTQPIADTIAAWLERQHDAPPLVILDTLGKVMPPAGLGESAYQRDYRVGSTLKQLADERAGMTLLTNHHDRKANSEDFIDSVSGTHGLAGAADTVIVLARARNEETGLLKVTGRDVPEGEYALCFQDGHYWKLDGGDLDEAAQHARDTRATAGLGDRSAEVIKYVGRHPQGVTPAEVAEALDIDPATARVYLRRADEAGRLSRPRRGVYTPVTSVTPVTSDDASPSESNGSNGSNAPPGRRWRCSRCGFVTTHQVVASYPHTNCGGLFDAAQEAAS